MSYDVTEGSRLRGTLLPFRAGQEHKTTSPSNLVYVACDTYMFPLIMTLAKLL